MAKDGYIYLFVGGEAGCVFDSIFVFVSCGVVYEISACVSSRELLSLAHASAYPRTYTHFPSLPPPHITHDRQVLGRPPRRAGQGVGRLLLKERERRQADGLTPVFLLAGLMR